MPQFKNPDPDPAAVMPAGPSHITNGQFILSGIRSDGPMIIRIGPGRSARLTRAATNTLSRTVTAAFRTDNCGDALRIGPARLCRFSHRSVRGAAHQGGVLGEHAARGIGFAALSRPRGGALIQPPQAPRGSRARRASTTIRSPVFNSPMGPPTAASGEICPTTKPWLPPEKRPSVIRATLSPSPRPMMAPVGLSISRMPGPPRGPSLRITTTSPGAHRAGQDRLRGAFLAVEHARAARRSVQPFLAGDLGHRALGREVPVEDDQVAVLLQRARRAGARCPARSGTWAPFCQILRSVRPVTVRQSPCSRPRLEQHLHQRLDAADRHQLRHQVAAARAQVRQHRHAPADAGEIVQCQLHAAPRARSPAGAARRWWSRPAR